MRRALNLLLSVAVIAAATVMPAFTCLPGTTVGEGSQHSCCEPSISPAPAGTCCAVSQPVRARAITESRYATPDDCRVATALVDHVQRLGSGSPPGQRLVSTASLVRAVPIYLQQLSLLI
jgi:hypothetical protein